MRENAALADVTGRLAVSATGHADDLTALPALLVQVTDGARVAAIRHDNDARTLRDFLCEQLGEVIVAHEVVARKLALRPNEAQRLVLPVLLITVLVLHARAMARVVEDKVVIIAAALRHLADPFGHVFFRALVVVHDLHVLDAAGAGQCLHVVAVQCARQRARGALVVQGADEQVDLGWVRHFAVERVAAIDCNIPGLERAPAKHCECW
mmetsp:Transcript_49444/g.127601  ORF Transcript_49444/g.127601 Transcript_49444/m.127601 type:complete len:210 (+) Transcript_49444:690-1319(+)